MRLTVFEANGQIGQSIVGQALQTGYTVIAYTRRPNALAINHENLQIVVGSLTDKEK